MGRDRWDKLKACAFRGAALSLASAWMVRVGGVGLFRAATSTNREATMRDPRGMGRKNRNPHVLWGRSTVEYAVNATTIAFEKKKVIALQADVRKYSNDKHMQQWNKRGGLNQLPVIYLKKK